MGYYKHHNEEFEQCIKACINNLRLRGDVQAMQLVSELSHIWHLHEEAVKDLEQRQDRHCRFCEEKDKEISSLRTIVSLREKRQFLEDKFRNFGMVSLSEENQKLKKLLEEITKTDVDIYEAMHQIKEYHKEQYGHDGSSFARLAEVTESN